MGQPVVHFEIGVQDKARAEAGIVLRCLPPKLQLLGRRTDPHPWAADPVGLRRMCDSAVQCLNAVPADTPPLRRARLRPGVPIAT